MPERKFILWFKVVNMANVPEVGGKNASLGEMIRIHDLRHTYASHYMMNGGSLTDLQALLGHTRPDMTLKYAHLAPLHLAGKSSVVAMSCARQIAPVTSLSNHKQSAS